MIELSVIIVNYNGQHYLAKCIDSLHEKLKNILFEIIILDNNSSDNSCNFIKEKYSDVILIESKANYGFGKGNNKAVQCSKGKYLLLLNNDTIILEQLAPVLDFYKLNQEIGVVGINMVDENKKYLPAAGNFPNFFNLLILKNFFKISHEFQTGVFSKNQYEVDWLGGSFLMLSKKIYNEIKGFDEDYFMYVEDVDFCKKIADIGKKRVFYPNYSYIHFVGFNSSKNFMLIKGLKIYLKKHSFGIEKIKLQIALEINSFVKLIKTALKLN